MTTYLRYTTSALVVAVGPILEGPLQFSVLLFSREEGMVRFLRRVVARIELTTLYLVWFWAGIGLLAMVGGNVRDWIGNLMSSDLGLAALLLFVPWNYSPAVWIGLPLAVLRALVLAVRRRGFRWFLELGALLATAAWVFSTWEVC